MISTVTFVTSVNTFKTALDGVIDGATLFRWIFFVALVHTSLRKVRQHQGLGLSIVYFDLRFHQSICYRFSLSYQ